MAADAADANISITVVAAGGNSIITIDAAVAAGANISISVLAAVAAGDNNIITVVAAVVAAVAAGGNSSIHHRNFSV